MTYHRWEPTGQTAFEAVGMACRRCGLSLWCRGAGPLPARRELELGTSFLVERELLQFETPDASCERRGLPVDCDVSVAREVLES